jgi:hypothetical protein
MKFGTRARHFFVLIRNTIFVRLSVLPLSRFGLALAAGSAGEARNGLSGAVTPERRR